jgi:hypothetical protein
MKAPFQILIVGDYLFYGVVGAVIPFVAINARRAHLTHLACVEHPPLFVCELHGIGIPRGLHPPLPQETLWYAKETRNEEAETRKRYKGEYHLVHAGTAPPGMYCCLVRFLPLLKHLAHSLPPLA